jgi:hypothetical protein
VEVNVYSKLFLHQERAMPNPVNIGDPCVCDHILRVYWPLHMDPAVVANVPAYRAAHPLAASAANDAHCNHRQFYIMDVSPSGLYLVCAHYPDEQPPLGGAPGTENGRQADNAQPYLGTDLVRASCTHFATPAVLNTPATGASYTAAGLPLYTGAYTAPPGNNANYQYNPNGPPVNRVLSAVLTTADILEELSGFKNGKQRNPSQQSGASFNAHCKCTGHAGSSSEFGCCALPTLRLTLLRRLLRCCVDSVCLSVFSCQSG